MVEQTFTEVFALVMQLARALGVERIDLLPGCWEVQVDDDWWFACNGHRVPTRCTAGAEVPPFELYVTFGGWPAGLIGPHAGTLCAGAAGNEESLIEALRARIALAKGG
jgi:hypothetical protein